MVPKIEKVVDNCIFGEGPHWDVETQSLYFVDVITKSINRYVPSTNKYTKANLDVNHVSIIIPVRGEKNKFLVSLERELAIVTWDGESDKVSDTKKIFEVGNNPESLGARFNDGKCDPSGRLWIGTMGDPTNRAEKRGSFYSFQDNKLSTFLTEVGLSNGLAFNAELKKTYYIDSFEGRIDEFDFDIVNGSVGNRKSIFTLGKHDIPGGPDGMAIDTDGNLWVAIMGGSRVIKIDPRKPDTLLDTIFLPSKQVTSVAFGGPSLDELYVTTARWSNKTDGSPDDGSVFKISEINAKGFPGVSVVL